ncbi:hypothetical protein [Streptomyces sp. NPDC002520]
MSQPPAMTVATRRALVRQLRADDPTLSARKIAGQVGVGKDTILRDLEAISQEDAQAAPEPDAVEPEGAPDAPDGAPADAPPDADRLTVALDDQLRTGLTVLAHAGHTPEDAVRLAVAVLARAYEGAWKFGLYPHGIAPRVRVVKLYPYNPKGPTQ